MSRALVNVISDQTAVLFRNARIGLRTCDLNAIIYSQPVWKHVYHAFHSLDRWFINPAVYEEPSFHEPDLNSLDVSSLRTLTGEELEAYLAGIETKICGYLAGLSDNMLAEKPEGCEYSRMSLVLGQFRHLYAHIGIINCSTINTTGKWPRVIGLNSVFTDEDEFFE
jgi:hypothetical protein